MRPGRALALGAALLAQTGCASIHLGRLAPHEAPIVLGPPVRDNRTPLDPVFACYAAQLARQGKAAPIVAVGEVRDYTGKYSVNEGNAITQGGALMVASALGKLSGQVRLAERFDPAVGERELGYADRRQLGDGASHELAGSAGPQKVPWLPYYGGSIVASDYYIVGGITELNYDVRSGGAEIGVSGVGPRLRTYTQSVAIDLRMVDTRTLLVVRTVSLAKQFTGYETGAGVFRFFGSNLFDINIGAKAQEPLQLGIRTALEEATLRLVGAAVGLDPRGCLAAAAIVRAPAEPLLAPSDPVRTAGPAAGAALNLAGAAAVAAPGALAIVFEVGSDSLPASAAAALEHAARETAAAIVVAGRDSEALEPAQRDALTDRRIAAIARALAARGIDPAALRTVWRADRDDRSVHRQDAGLQVFARLRLDR